MMQSGVCVGYQVCSGDEGLERGLSEKRTNGPMKGSVSASEDGVSSAGILGFAMSMCSTTKGGASGKTTNLPENVEHMSEFIEYVALNVMR